MSCNRIEDFGYELRPTQLITFPQVSGILGPTAQKSGVVAGCKRPALVAVPLAATLGARPPHI